MMALTVAVDSPEWAGRKEYRKTVAEVSCTKGHTFYAQTWTKPGTYKCPIYPCKARGEVK